MTSTRHSRLSRPRDDELVEEIATHIDSAMYRYAKWNAQGLLRVTKREMARSVAKQLIALALKAVVDGMPLPGEYYRGDGVNIEQIEATRALFHRRSAEDQKDLMGYEYALDDLLDVAHSIIAFLSPEEKK